MYSTPPSPEMQTWSTPPRVSKPNALAKFLCGNKGFVGDSFPVLISEKLILEKLELVGKVRDEPGMETSQHGMETSQHGTETSLHGIETSQHGMETSQHGMEPEEGAESPPHKRHCGSSSLDLSRELF